MTNDIEITLESVHHMNWNYLPALRFISDSCKEAAFWLGIKQTLLAIKATFELNMNTGTTQIEAWNKEIQAFNGI